MKEIISWSKSSHIPVKLSPHRIIQTEFHTNPFPCPSYRARRAHNLHEQTENPATARFLCKSPFKARPGFCLCWNPPTIRFKKNWGSRSIKSPYTIWIGRNLWTLACSISNVSLFANFPDIPTFPCSISQDFNNILCGFLLLTFHCVFFFSYLLFSSYTKSSLFYTEFSTEFNNLFKTLILHFFLNVHSRNNKNHKNPFTFLWMSSIIIQLTWFSCYMLFPRYFYLAVVQEPSFIWILCIKASAKAVQINIAQSCLFECKFSYKVIYSNSTPLISR